ncbi:hypothetical protein [Pendulispora albinea]|uniref:Altered inheritance of mitochondria protein 41 n=1 Tax=Pendulispora albinea TaxID=2741071 RepID=A0ABZ2M380_9BACT
MNRSLSVLLAAAVASMAMASGAGCRKSEPPPDPKRAAFQEMNRKLDASERIVAADETARAVAARVDRELTAGGRIPPEQLKMVVETGKIGQHRRVVILAKIDRLKNETSSNRKMMLEQIVSVASQGLGEDDEIAIGLRDAVFYGAIARGGTLGEVEQEVGATLDTKPLEEAIAEMKGLPVGR